MIRVFWCDFTLRFRSTVRDPVSIRAYRIAVCLLLISSDFSDPKSDSMNSLSRIMKGCWGLISHVETRRGVGLNRQRLLLL